MHSKTPKENCSLHDKEDAEQIKGSAMSNRRGGMVPSSAGKKITAETISLCLSEMYVISMHGRKQKLLENLNESFLTCPNCT